MRTNDLHGEVGADAQQRPQRQHALHKCGRGVGEKLRLAAHHAECLLLRYEQQVLQRCHAQLQVLG